MTQAVAHHRRLFLALAATAVALAVSRAYAMDVPFDPTAWGSNPALALLALTGFIAWLRSTPVGERLDGPVLVPLVTVAIGAASGAALQLASMLTYAPYNTWASPLGGVAYGALIAASAITGISLFNYGAGKLSTAVAAKTPLATATQFITQFLVTRYAGSVPVAAWNAVSGLLSEYAAHEGFLTDDLRATIQARILAALRAAGLGGTDLE